MRSKRLVFNVLLLLTHYELDAIIVDGAPLVRRAKLEDKHFLAELARARFLSDLLRRKTFRRITPAHESGEEETAGTREGVAGEGTGIKYRAIGTWAIGGQCITVRGLPNNAGCG